MAKEVLFEIKSKDIAGRIGRMELNGKAAETPALMPVYSIAKPVISPKELSEEFGCRFLMTNSYIILKNPEIKAKIEERGIHSFLGFDGLIATDSGSYQLMEYGNVTTTNAEIVAFQERIGSDIGSFLDLPTLPDAYKPRAEEQLETTLSRAREIRDANILINAGIQGATYPDLRAKAAKELGAMFRLCAVGGIVRLMETYRFAELVDVIAAVKENLPANRIVHAFGMGHPMVFPLAVAMGCDLFDSAAYALYAEGGRYLTPYGTKRITELDYLPCACPVCRKYGLELKELPVDEQKKQLARHNLYVSVAEIDAIKQAIRENTLWDLVGQRCRAHPQLYKGFLRLLEKEYLSYHDPVTKNSAFYAIGCEAEKRSEVVNARKRIGRVHSENLFTLPAFGDVPGELADMYPFNSLVEDAETKPCKASDLEKIRAIMDYQFGSGAGELILEKVRIKKSRTTRRIRWIYEGKELIASVRASDHFIIPKEKLAEALHKKFPYPKNRIVIEGDAIEFVKQGKSVFSKFVVDIDCDLRPGDEVLVVDREDNLLRTGSLVLSPKEALDFDRGPAAQVR